MTVTGQGSLLLRKARPLRAIASVSSKSVTGTLLASIARYRSFLWSFDNG